MNLIDSVGACCRLVFWDVDRESNAVWRWYNVRKQVRKIVQTREIYPEEGLFSYLTDFLGNPLILIMFMDVDSYWPATCLSVGAQCLTSAAVRADDPGGKKPLHSVHRPEV